MQSKILATAAARARGSHHYHQILSVARINHEYLRRQLSTSPTGISADPGLYSDDQDDKDAEEAARYESNKDKEPQYNPNKEKKPFVPSKAPFTSSPKLESTEVLNQPQDPIHQRKRTNSTIPLGEISCVGIDGTPLPSDNKEDRQHIRQEQEEDDIEYFKHRKASPLSEIEFVDSRKPISRAMDETPDIYPENSKGGVVTWRPEQLDTAEEALRRANEIWKQNASNGIPEWPHSRVLRELRGESW